LSHTFILRNTEDLNLHYAAENTPTFTVRNTGDADASYDTESAMSPLSTATNSAVLLSVQTQAPTPSHSTPTRLHPPCRSASSPTPPVTDRRRHVRTHTGHATGGDGVRNAEQSSIVSARSVEEVTIATNSNVNRQHNFPAVQYAATGRASCDRPVVVDAPFSRQTRASASQPPSTVNLGSSLNGSYLRELSSLQCSAYSQQTDRSCSTSSSVRSHRTGASATTLDACKKYAQSSFTVDQSVVSQSGAYRHMHADAGPNGTSSSSYTCKSWAESVKGLGAFVNATLDSRASRRTVASSSSSSSLPFRECLLANENGDVMFICKQAKIPACMVSSTLDSSGASGARSPRRTWMKLTVYASSPLKVVTSVASSQCLQDLYSLLNSLQSRAKDTQVVPLEDGGRGFHRLTNEQLLKYRHFFNSDASLQSGSKVLSTCYVKELKDYYLRYIQQQQQEAHGMDDLPRVEPQKSGVIPAYLMLFEFYVKAALIIEVIRKRTPAAIMYLTYQTDAASNYDQEGKSGSCMCKCSVMSNFPVPDFSVMWLNGATFKYSLQSGAYALHYPASSASLHEEHGSVSMVAATVTTATTAATLVTASTAAAYQDLSDKMLMYEGELEHGTSSCSGAQSVPDAVRPYLNIAFRAMELAYAEEKKSRREGQQPKRYASGDDEKHFQNSFHGRKMDPPKLNEYAPRVRTLNL
jgi:hypothetical protein